MTSRCTATCWSCRSNRRAVESTAARRASQTPVSADRFRGVRVFDISDIKKPRQVAAVQTCRGSHTHTLVTNPKDKANIYVYGSGTGSVRAADELTGCSKADPKEDPNTALFSIDVIQIPIAAPEKASIVNRPRIFADPKTGDIAGLWRGGDHGPGTQKTSETNRCHDITVFPALGLAAGACSGNGILLDISDPVNPVRLDQVEDKSFAFWHSATFNNDGTKVIFTDEWGGGTRPRCRSTDQPNWGANAIFDIVEKQAALRELLQDSCPADRHRKLCRPQRLADSGAGSRHHGAGLVSGRCVGLRFHRFDEAGRDRVLRPRSDQCHRPDHRRSLVDLLVQRQHLWHRDRPWGRRAAAEAERVFDRERAGTPRPSFRRRCSTRRTSQWSSGRRAPPLPVRISIS